MKPRNLVVLAIAAATLGMSSLSFAQQQSRHHNGPRYEAPRPHQGYDHRRDFRPAPQVRHYRNARGPEFRRGRYIPREYRDRRYVVVNPRAHRLYAPPRGHQWVQVGSDYVLVAVATGLIAHLILSR